MTDYSHGRYLVFGYGKDAKQIGLINQDGFVRSSDDSNVLIYRIDGDQVYDMDDNYLGDIDEGTAISANGEHLFTIQAE
ncbi:hypothetical protein IQ22_00664 [Pseudomonas duriflava]|uniref:Uncharacterized protein n=1 Tax=Pseudomonas duriflava TaxID=459528 RepID=A0A562QKZ4_9PSED|nr:hypothetical protein [Pseudomonas duriflava]TWI57448.1 hypothetical protein IQ22_00664 [Pseudomonas duriflava]